MSENAKTARAYARACFEVAQSPLERAKWSDMLAFLATVSLDADMQRLMSSPSIHRDRLADVVLQVAAGRLSVQGQNLVRLLAENARMDALPLIAEEFDALCREADGRMNVRVVSAMALQEQEKIQLASALGRRLGKVITLDNEVDASLIGGAIVYAGDLVIDGSIQGRLQSLANAVVR
ncbi:MAG: F0F1 ATP synthase subunit delta [Pseudomonadota bacterium]